MNTLKPDTFNVFLQVLPDRPSEQSMDFRLIGGLAEYTWSIIGCVDSTHH